MRRGLALALALATSCSSAPTGALDEAEDAASGDFGADAGATELGPMDLGAPDAGPPTCDSAGGAFGGRWRASFGWIVIGPGEPARMLDANLGIGPRSHLETLEILPDGRFVGRSTAAPSVERRGCLGVGPEGQVVLQIDGCRPACDELFDANRAALSWAPTGAPRLELRWTGTAYRDPLLSGGCGPRRPLVDDVCEPLPGVEIHLFYDQRP